MELRVDAGSTVHALLSIAQDADATVLVFHLRATSRRRHAQRSNAHSFVNLV